MIGERDIGWLAGVFDGEGCVFVQRSTRKSKSSSRVVRSLEIVLANSSSLIIDRYVMLLNELGVAARVVFEPRFSKRPMFYVKVSRKHDALVLARALLPHVTEKRAQLLMAEWYLDRSCRSRQHVATAQDVQVLDAITAAKRGAPIPEGIISLLH